jgi:hypothetical protein
MHMRIMHMRIMHLRCIWNALGVHWGTSWLTLHMMAVASPARWSSNAFEMHLKCIWDPRIQPGAQWVDPGIPNAFQMHFKCIWRPSGGWCYGHHVQCESRCPSMHSKCIWNAYQMHYSHMHYFHMHYSHMHYSHMYFKCIRNAYEKYAYGNNALFSYAYENNAFEMHFKCIWE